MKNVYAVVITGLCAMSLVSCQPDKNKPKKCDKCAPVNMEESISSESIKKADEEVSNVEEADLVPVLSETEELTSSENEVSTILEEMTPEQSISEEKAVFEANENVSVEVTTEDDTAQLNEETLEN